MKSLMVPLNMEVMEWKCEKWAEGRRAVGDKQGGSLG